ncbi:MAG TPA: hypothetical protein VFO40_14420 [Chthoniobacterales bacterium]|nr:hypothetical protein [Chthoniobacterales bacterium]
MKALPQRLRISIEGHFGPSYEVTFKEGHLTYTYLPSRDSCSHEPEPELTPELRQLLGLKPYPQPEEIQPSAKQWQNFRRTLNRLNVWCWQANYSDPAVCDGTGWSAEIVYSDRSLVSSGDNCFPGQDGRALSITEDGTDNTLEKFCRAIARLIGREFH